MKGTTYQKPRSSFTNLYSLSNLSENMGQGPLKASASNGMPKKTVTGRYHVQCVDCKGCINERVLDRHHLRQVLKIAARDLRILEPGLATTFPAAVLDRDKALLVNLEELKVIVTDQEVYIFNHETLRAKTMIEQLRKKLQGTDGAGQAARRRSKILASDQHAGTENLSHSGGDSFDDTQDILVPFEVKVLDVLFENYCSYLESMWISLESAALPAMDSLTRKVTSSGLERVRRVKNHMTRLTSKVEDFKDVLQHYLDDDKDMFDLIISRKGGLLGPGTASKLTPHSEIMVRTPLERKHSEAFVYDDDEDFQECEMLFESYFILADNLFDKLSDLSEYIDDTEDLINIELDHHRNQLIQLELVLTTATFSIALIGVVSGIFGMNIRNESESSHTTFLMVTVISCLGSVLLFFAIMLFCRHKKLLFFS
ncbi:putative magnesium transporter [Chloropicon primus]|uniref:Magnesium transporter n=1 Tax=Chloropicon primus TaxID=1764295 RepID=A0A5B8MD65_9CHLO|nr:putative magnesium transporter [Chloropicon primus]UPQ97373.1 putative magnesium transporter [Chloropicon primus]|eukprot:QDZ18161.1 putative magnesium transporter [Chloropicon primus]